MGAVLKVFRNNHLIDFQVAIMGATPHDSPQAKAVHSALKAIDELRNVMDDLVHEDYFDEIGDEFKKIYYGEESK
jgi:hypothetical protein